MKKEVSMVYVAFCVTLTCTAATMTTFTFGSETTRYSVAIRPPEAVESPLYSFRSSSLNSGASQNNRRNFFATRYKLDRNNNSLAIGGLSV